MTQVDVWDWDARDTAAYRISAPSVGESLTHTTIKQYRELSWHHWSDESQMTQTGLENDIIRKRSRQAECVTMTQQSSFFRFEKICIDGGGNSSKRGG